MLRKKKSDKGLVEYIAYRFCGKPSQEDADFESRTIGCCRYLWNRMLADHNILYEEIRTVSKKKAQGKTPLG